MSKVIILLLVCLCSCGYINKQLGLKDDHLGEEVVEAVIKAELGVDVDLTPGTSEK